MTKLALSIEEAAEAINVSVPTMRELINQPDFPAIRMGRSWIIPVDAFSAWLNDQGRAGARY